MRLLTFDLSSVDRDERLITICNYEQERKDRTIIIMIKFIENGLLFTNTVQ